MLRTMKFKKRTDVEKRSARIPILFTKTEEEAVRQSAENRGLSVSDFIRRTALGRKADARYEPLVILELREVALAIHALHKEYLQHGFIPPEEVLEPVILEAVAAIKRVA